MFASPVGLDLPRACTYGGDGEAWKRGEPTSKYSNQSARSVAACQAKSSAIEVVGGQWLVPYR